MKIEECATTLVLILCTIGLNFYMFSFIDINKTEDFILAGMVLLVDIVCVGVIFDGIIQTIYEEVNNEQ